jgi:hypothetical protein
MRRKLAVSMIGVALAAGIWFYYGARSEANLKTARVQSNSVESESHFGPATVVNPRAPHEQAVIRQLRLAPTRDEFKASRPLPPLKLPLRDIYSELQDLAQNGNAFASCRLGYELARCRDLPEKTRRMQEYKTQLAALREDSDVRQPIQWALDRVSAAQEAAAKVCEGFPPAETANAWRYQFAAAQAGHIESMTRFAAPTTLDSANFLSDIEGWLSYKYYALPMVQQAAVQGDPRAILQLGFFYLLPISGIEHVPRDPAMTVALWSTLTPLASPEYRPVLEKEIQSLIRRSNISPLEIASAQEKVQGSKIVPRPQTDRPIDFTKGIIGPDDDGAHCTRTTR